MYCVHFGHCDFIFTFAKEIARIRTMVRLYIGNRNSPRVFETLAEANLWQQEGEALKLSKDVLFVNRISGSKHR